MSMFRSNVGKPIGLCAWQAPPCRARAGAILRQMKLVAPAGFEPAISALRGLRPRPLDDGATFLVGGVGVEPTTSRV